MSEMIDTAAAVRLLQGMEDVAILCHKSPDGDTLGCGFALLYALQKLGKRAVVLCKDPLPDRYAYLGEGTHTEPPFVPKAVVAVDTASDALLGEPLQLYADRVDLCIDHHPSNTGYAKRLLLRPTAAAACELMTDLLTELSGLDEQIADCLYTGLVTDTGCFKHPSVTVGHPPHCTAAAAGRRTDAEDSPDVRQHDQRKGGADCLCAGASAL